jgi:hypothetical protein
MRIHADPDSPHCINYLHILLSSGPKKFTKNKKESPSRNLIPFRYLFHTLLIKKQLISSPELPVKKNRCARILYGRMAARLYVLPEEALRQVLEALALALQGEEEDGVPDGGGGVVQPQHLHRAFCKMLRKESETACSLK